MAALNRPVTASYEVHENVRVDTEDNEDHTFCGIMFPIKAKAILPVQHIVVHSVAVRGELGDLSVYVTKDTANQTNYNFRMQPSQWKRVYAGKHKPVAEGSYATLCFDPPVIIRPGQVRLLYVHSTIPDDSAIVYDNSNFGQRRVRYQDNCISIHSGKAHLSPVPFGQIPIWGWGNAWRDRREFVGQVQYGCVYKLWSPERHLEFGGNFDRAMLTLLLLQRCRESPVSILPDECLYYIMNICKWDWFQDEGEGMKRRYRARKLRRLAEAETTSMDQEEQPMEEEDDDAMVEDEIGEEEDDDVDPEDDDDDMWERANGYRADPRGFEYNDVSSDEEDEQQEEQHAAQRRAWWFRRHFARVHILEALHGHNGTDGEGDNDDDDDSDFEE